MFIFKTSSETFESVIRNEMHAFRGEPKDWFPGEIILVSKNRAGLNPGEKQISYVMKFKNVRKLESGEAQRLWPGNEGRWNYIVECVDNAKLTYPFDLVDVIGAEQASKYGPIITAGKIHSSDEMLIEPLLSTAMPIHKGRERKENGHSAVLRADHITSGSGEPSAISVWVIAALLVGTFILGAIFF